METSEVMRNLRNVTSLSSSRASSFRSPPSLSVGPANDNAHDDQRSSGAHAPA